MLNKREIKFTLKTKNVNEAKALAPAKIIQIDLMLRRAEELLKAEQSLCRQSPVSLRAEHLSNIHLICLKDGF
ncbi:hypothetical protein ACFJ30_002900 [Salmonella enterica]